MTVRYIPSVLVLALLGALVLAAVPVAQRPAVAQESETIVYEVGPSKALQRIADVPWESLAAGSTVKIYWKAEGYHEKFGVFTRGTETKPIAVSGVPGPGGELPVIDGRNATTRKGLAFYNEDRSVCQIGGLKDSQIVPGHIVIENLELRSGRHPYTFTDSAGQEQTYQTISSSIRFNVCDGVTVRNCIIRDSGNGTLSSPTTANITIEGCLYIDNGLDESDPHSVGVHQTYTQARGILYQYNYFAPLREGCLGSNLKDRSSGNIIRYNWIEGGNKQIDLPDSSDRDEIMLDPRYRETFVYGNVLIEHEGDGQPEMVTYGGDMGDPSKYRKGTLYFYNNTVISHRTDPWFLIKLKTNDESADVRNNIIYAAGDGSLVAMSGWHGTLRMSHNWLKPGWKDSHAGDEFDGEVIDDHTQILGTDPGFADLAAQDFHLAAGSACVDKGMALARAAEKYPVVMQYVKHRGLAPRPKDACLDIGAYELDKAM